jgi:hypothetical protein
MYSLNTIKYDTHTTEQITVFQFEFGKLEAKFMIVLN